MKSLLQYIIEAKGVSKEIDILTSYIFNKIKEYVYLPNSVDSKVSWLYQQCKDYGYDEYPIEINFNDIDGFNIDKYNLLTYKMMGEDYIDYNCDMIINITKMDDFGSMETDEPMLNINLKYIKTQSIFEKNRVALLNTIAHELTHYIQHLSNLGSHQLKSTSRSVTKELRENTKGNMRYYLCDFLLYVMNPIEMDARKQGFYQTMKEEFDKRLKEWNKKHKKEKFDEDSFINFCLYHPKYHNHVLHMEYFDILKNSIQQDTWENYKKCFDDKINKYRDDSIIYVLLNICDERESKPHIPLPSKKCYVMYINNEEKFNNYKDKLLKDYSKNLDDHKKKLSKVIKYIINQKNIK